MLRRASRNQSHTAFVVVLALLAPRAARAADAPDIVAPITPAPGAQVPGGGGLRLADAVQLVLTRNERARISDLNVDIADAAVEKARAGWGLDPPGSAMATAARALSISALTRFNSEQISAACWKRFSQSFSSALARMPSRAGGKHEFTLLAATGLALRIASITNTRFLATKGRRPVAIS